MSECMIDGTAPAGGHQMSRWKVTKAKVGWWAHEPGCYRLGGLFCSGWFRCVGPVRFDNAFCYAETMAALDRRKA